MKRFLFVILFYWLSFHLSYSVPSYPQKVAINVNGEDVYIQLCGDENCKYALDENGYTILPTSDGWKYAMLDEQGCVKASQYLLSAKENMRSETLSFLSRTQKNIIPKRSDSVFCKQLSQDARLSPAIGTRKALVILMQFRDTKFTKSQNDFFRLFNEREYKEEGALGSVYDYYQWASYGQLHLVSDVLGPFEAKNNMSYYGGNTGVGGNDKNPYALFSEALEYAINEINLSDYDADGDGFLDNIHIIYAGYGEEAGASANAIWAHEMTFRTITIQGMKIDRYSCAPELRGNRGSGISRIGPHCHEIGHALGAMDYYDTDYETGGSYQGTGKWDIMASGSWNNDGISPADFNPYVKVYNYGWTEATSLKHDETNIIGISSKMGNIYRVNTSVSNDYFLLENRNNKEFHSAEPGPGLLIFHIGPNLQARAATNTINSTYPQQCYVVCASSTYTSPTAKPISYGDINSAGCPFPGTSNNTRFSDNSTPAAFTVSGKTTGINISKIAFDGENIVFHYIGNDDSNPAEPDTNPNNVYLWGEDFEQLRLPSSWVYTDVENSGKIEVITKLSDNDTPQSPIADSGSGYAKFTAEPQPIMGEYITVGKLISPHIKLEENKDYILSFSIRKYNKTNSHDSIIVKLYSENNTDELKLEEKEIEMQDSWERQVFALPNNFNDLSIGFFLEISPKTIIFIDNIRISENTKNKIQDVQVKSEKEQTVVYTISGTRSLQLRRGLNIVRYSNGTYKKIIKK